MERESEKASIYISEDVVEKIVAMMPFPSMYKAQCITKAWQAKFSPTPASTSFQKQVAEGSSKWDTFCPVLVAGEGSMAYNRATQTWREMPSMSFLPEGFLNRTSLQMEGALLYSSEPDLVGVHEEIHVANVLTRSYKKLPACPNVNFRSAFCEKLSRQMPRLSADPEPGPNVGFHFVFCEKLVIAKSLDSYKVIRLCRVPAHEWCPCRPRCAAIPISHIYDSNVDVWTSKELDLPHWFCFYRPPGIENSAYLDGSMYMVGEYNPSNILAYNIEEGTCEYFTLPYTRIECISAVNLVVGNANLFMVVTEGFFLDQTHILLKIDLGSQELTEVARGPPAALNVGATHIRPVGDGNYIFVGVELRGRASRMLAYSLEENEWSCFSVPDSSGVCVTKFSRFGDFPRTKLEKYYRWISSSFRPGLSPFMAV